PPGAAPVRWVQGFGEELPFPDSSFDRVTAQFSLRNMRDWRRGLAEMVRVLKPGGLLAVLDLVQPTTTLGALAMRALEGVTRPLSVPELEPYRWLGRSLLHAATGAELTAAMAAAAGSEVAATHWLGDLVLLAVVRRAAAPLPGPAPRRTPRAVWATDGSLTALRAGAWIRDHLAPGMEVHVVTVCPPPPDDAQVAATDRVAWLRHRDASLEVLPGDRFTVVPVLLDGQPGPRLVEYVRRVEAELLVVGRKARTRGARELLGDVAAFAFRHASCPVLAVDGP
ncbi:MAG: class I SAM-dependent methyltransferase, partial [Firmicutes bacterium]|nr:class I SAM-dependent methyltransferase [Bacillota bacterium]